MRIFDIKRLEEFILKHRGASLRQIDISFYRLKKIISNPDEMTFAENEKIIKFAETYTDYTNYLKQ